MNVLCIYLGERRGAYMNLYGNTLSTFTTEPLDGYLRNLVGVKYS